MDKDIKCLLLDVDNVIISEVVEVDAELGDPNCKLIKPYRFYSEDHMEPWANGATEQEELMMRAEDMVISTLVLSSSSSINMGLVATTT